MRLSWMAGTQVRPAPLGEGSRIRGVQCDGSILCGDRLLVSTQQPLRTTEIVEGPVELRVLGRGVREQLDCSRQVLVALSSFGRLVFECVVCVRFNGGSGRGRLLALQADSHGASAQLGVSTIAIRSTRGWIERDGRVVVTHRSRVLVQRLVGDGSIVIGLGKVLVDGDRLIKVADGVTIASGVEVGTASSCVQLGSTIAGGR